MFTYYASACMGGIFALRYFCINILSEAELKIMQPSPRADTSKPLFPSFLFCIIFFVLDLNVKLHISAIERCHPIAPPFATSIVKQVL